MANFTSFAQFDHNTIVAVLRKSGGHCWYCGSVLTLQSRYEKPNGETFVIDHFAPRYLGGTDEISNLVPSCWSCNSSKRIKTLEEFRFLKRRKLAGMPRFNEEQLEYLLAHGIQLPELPEFLFYFEKEGLKP